MIRRILTFFRLDVALSMRDSIMIYSLVSPLALALIVRLVVPSVQETTFTMALSSDLPSQTVERLASFGEVELYDSDDAIRDRVNQNDDVPGLLLEGDRYVLLLEGNEDEGAAEGFRTLVADALDEAERPAISVSDLEGSAVPVLEYGAVMLVLLGLFVGGILVGFNIVEEKETGAIRALAVSPLRMLEYIAARSVLAVVIAYASGFGAAYIILGASVPAGALALSIAAALFVALPFGFIIGGFADNQMTAFALIKLLMAFFLTVPFVSIFVPDRFQLFFYPFPNYWMFQAVSGTLAGSSHVGPLPAHLLAAGTGLVMVALLVPRLRKGLRLR